MTTLTPEQAMLAGYATVTAPYSRHEKELLRAALLTMAGCRVALVSVAHGTEIWRLKSEIRETGDELSAADVKQRGRKKL